MKSLFNISAALATACAVLSLCGTAGATGRAAAPAAVQFGVTEDGKGTDGGLWFFEALTDLGMTQNRTAAMWSPTQPTAIYNKEYLDSWLPQAMLSGIRIVLAVAPARARDLTATRTAPQRFVQYLQLLARTYPQIGDFVIGNEPNQPRFWQPQFGAGGKPLAAAAYEKVLARSYDALKAVDPSINVIGVGLSPRGNDNPRARSNVSTSPVRFLRDLGAAYRASKRNRPIMDQLAFHPYPRQNTDAPGKGYAWPNAGMPNLGRIKQAVWDAFNGTVQPTFAESGLKAPPNALKFILDEVGWQVAIPEDVFSFYSGEETVRTVDERTQARFYANVVRQATCDSSVASLSFFHLGDETDLDRWQSGLIRADGSHRPAYGAVKYAIGATKGRCRGKLAVWRHANGVVGAKVRFARPQVVPSATSWRALATVEEEATFSAGLFRLSGSTAPRAAIKSALAARRIRGAALSASGGLKGNSSRYVRLPRRTVAPGTYVYAIRLAAAMNPARTTLVLSRPFRVVGPAKRG